MFKGFACIVDILAFDNALARDKVGKFLERASLLQKFKEPARPSQPKIGTIFGGYRSS